MLNTQRREFEAKFAVLASAAAPADLVNSFIGFILAAMYVFKIQGRVKAYNELTLEEATSLFTDDRVLSDKFKTVETYGYQVMQMPPWLKPFLKVYLFIYLLLLLDRFKIN